MQDGSSSQVTGPWISCSSHGEDLMGVCVCRDVHMLTHAQAHTPGGLGSFVPGD